MLLANTSKNQSNIITIETVIGAITGKSHKGSRERRNNRNHNSLRNKNQSNSYEL